MSRACGHSVGVWRRGVGGKIAESRRMVEGEKKKEKRISETRDVSREPVYPQLTQESLKRRFLEV